MTRLEDMAKLMEIRHIVSAGTTSEANRYLANGYSLLAVGVDPHGQGHFYLGTRNTPEVAAAILERAGS